MTDTAGRGAKLSCEVCGSSVAALDMGWHVRFGHGGHSSSSSKPGSSLDLGTMSGSQVSSPPPCGKFGSREPTGDRHILADEEVELLAGDGEKISGRLLLPEWQRTADARNVQPDGPTLVGGSKRRMAGLVCVGLAAVVLVGAFSFRLGRESGLADSKVSTAVAVPVREAATPVISSTACLDAIDSSNSFIRSLTGLVETITPALDMVTSGMEAVYAQDTAALDGLVRQSAAMRQQADPFLKGLAAKAAAASKAQASCRNAL